jgi:hypothetical protein
VPPLPGEDDHDQPDRASDAQLGKLGAMFTGIGVTDRQLRLDLTSTIVSRDIGSAKALTKAEASHVIEVLSRAADVPVPIGFIRNPGWEQT